MPPNLALLLCTVFVFYAFRSDRKRGLVVPKELFWPTLWYLVVASHPIGYWLSLWGVPLPSGGDDATEGSIVDRYFFATLTVVGFWILVRRRFSWGAALGRNPWLTMLLAFMALSICWSHYPFVSFKRYVKVLGSVVMALVVLTNERPLEATFTVIRRCLYIHLPMSILCTRYFRDIGVSYSYTGEGQAWIGISTSKNTLGQIAMLGTVYFFWELRQHWKEFRWKNLHLLYMLMGMYLLKGAGDTTSMTSISVCVLAAVVFVRIQSLRARPEAVRRFVWTVFAGIAALILLVITHSVVMFSEDSFFGILITKFGRDITLTDRTNIWNDVYAAAAGSPLIGVGFGGFWIGRIANIPWAASMSWVLGQGHDGYIDTYLQIGWIGVSLLAGVLISTVPRLLNSMADNFDFACFRITMLLTMMYVNITESTFLRGDHHLWFIMQLVLWMVPSGRPAGEVGAPPEPSATY